jgi:hypothetical protein
VTPATFPSEDRPPPAANSTAGEVQTRRRLHSKREGISREIYASFQDPAVKVVLGLQQQLRKIIKNLRKIKKKCKTNFVGFVVKKSIFSRKHV